MYSRRSWAKITLLSSLKKTVEIVNNIGGIDLGFLIHTIPHLVPSRMKRNHQYSSLPHQPFINGYLSVEVNEYLMSHREASRLGDDLIKWSLPLEEQVFEDAE